MNTQHTYIRREKAMRLLDLFLVSVLIFSGCSNDNITVPVISSKSIEGSSVQSYFHLAVGDTLVYSQTHLLVVENTALINSKTYYGITGFPIGAAVPMDFYIRQDEKGDVYAEVRFRIYKCRILNNK